MNKLNIILYVFLFAGILLASDPPEKLKAHWTYIPVNQSTFLYEQSLQIQKLSKAAELIPISDARTLGHSFYHQQINAEYGIDRLNRQIAEDKIDRQLFGSTGETASYYEITYRKELPFVSATYLQFVTDPRWDRVIYGNMNNWIRSLDDVQTPIDIAVDPTGRVYIAEKKPQHISVLQISGEGDAIDLIPTFIIKDIPEPTAIAHSDNGTPLNSGDDFLFVADASSNAIHKFGLGDQSAHLIYSYTELDTPTEICVGKFNGTSVNRLYVVDHYAKRISFFEDSGTELNLLARLNSDLNRNYTDMTVDHFGNIYLADHVQSEVVKYSPRLELLEKYSGEHTFNSLHAVEIPFGKVTVEEEGTYWVGFDQLFALEQWSDESGAQRVKIGFQVKDLTFLSDHTNSQIAATFTLTDAASLSHTVTSANASLVYEAPARIYLSGEQTIRWDRRDINGKFVRPGDYTVTFIAASPYSGNEIESSETFYLPLYYWQECGSTESGLDNHLVQGSPVRWGTDPGQTIVQDESSVMYSFSGLAPEGKYVVDVEYATTYEGLSEQNLTAGGIELHPLVRISHQSISMKDISLPQESYQNGSLTLEVNRFAAGPASISQLWLREIGRDIIATNKRVELPTEYALEQNFPNPFNPMTQISFNLPHSGNISLTVYDMLGRVVDVLVDGYKSAGRHALLFDATELASGLYIYRLQSGTFVQSRKMLLLR
jgi:hypothetical protein